LWLNGFAFPITRVVGDLARFQFVLSIHRCQVLFFNFGNYPILAISAISSVG